MQSRNRRNGAVVLGMVSLLILWFFSVPPDIRRANVCLTSGPASEQYSDLFALDDAPKDPSGVDNGSRECTEAAALWRRVLQFYQSCGSADGQPACVDFDLSVDPRSRLIFSEGLDALRQQLR